MHKSHTAPLLTPTGPLALTSAQGEAAPQTTTLRRARPRRLMKPTPCPARRLALSALFLLTTALASSSTPLAGDPEPRRLPSLPQFEGEGCDQRDHDLIMQAIRRRTSSLKRCYEQSLQSARPDLSGRVILSWTITHTGRVIDSRVSASTLDEPDMERCLSLQPTRWRFPVMPSDAGDCAVNLRLVFEKPTPPTAPSPGKPTPTPAPKAPSGGAAPAPTAPGLFCDRWEMRADKHGGDCKALGAALKALFEGESRGLFKRGGRMDILEIPACHRALKKTQPCADDPDMKTALRLLTGRPDL